MDLQSSESAVETWQGWKIGPDGERENIETRLIRQDDFAER